ncbi:MAG: hypothetical protein U9M92_03215 [Patescibacteria group bacterium]|nr:hypothetical protein [Patescibacteria group bacterium]
MTTSRSGMTILLLLAGLGAVLVLVGLFTYGSRQLRLVAQAEQRLVVERENLLANVETPAADIKTNEELATRVATSSNATSTPDVPQE